MDTACWYLLQGKHVGGCEAYVVKGIYACRTMRAVAAWWQHVVFIGQWGSQIAGYIGQLHVIWVGGTAAHQPRMMASHGGFLQATWPLLSHGAANLVYLACLPFQQLSHHCYSDARFLRFQRSQD